MKTIKIIAAAFAAIFMVSCGTYYRMVTTLDGKGNAIREVYTSGDSTFMAGNMTRNPYLFNIDSEWEITRYDSAMKYDFFGEEKNINVKVSQSAPSIDLFSQNLSYNKDDKSFAAPEETLIKEFRWFYTNHTFTGVYKGLSYNAPAPIDKYLSKEEQNLWTQGNFSNYGVMNGSEMNDMLVGLEDRFMDWYSSNCFEISLNSINKLSKENISDSDKEKIYKQLNEKNQSTDISPEIVCEALDSFYKTSHFSEIYDINKDSINLDFEKATSIINSLGNVISYELIVPGKILTTNSSIVNSNSLTWKVDGMHILFDDYTLTAEYRVVNIWAFILSGLILITAIASIALLIRGKRNK